MSALSWPRLWVWAIAFIHENAYFGWHASPESDAELMADMVLMLMASLVWVRK